MDPKEKRPVTVFKDLPKYLQTEFKNQVLLTLEKRKKAREEQLEMSEVPESWIKKFENSHSGVTLEQIEREISQGVAKTGRNWVAEVLNKYPSGLNCLVWIAPT